MFDDTLLFDIDKFSGYDRFETGTRANVGLQYTFQANNGVYARAVFGQSYPAGRRQPLRQSGPRSDLASVNYSPVSGLETNRSDYVAGVYLSPFTGLSLIAQAPVRREGLEPAPPGYRRCRPPTARSRLDRPTPSPQFDPVTGLIDNQQEIMGTSA